MTNSHVPALFTDLYELTMAASYFQHRMCAPATFSLFVRSLPPERNFLVVAGIEEVLHVLETFSFTTEEIEFLRVTRRFSADVLDYLAQLRFTGDVHALPEGSLCFAQEPLIEVTGPIIETQMIETVVLNAIHLQTLIASKAARSVIVAEGRSVMDFSLRRTHGTDAGVKVARASYLARFDGTSNVFACKRYGIPMYGTMAHSFIESFDDEEAAFQAYADTFPDDTASLIDTYDTVSSARRAARVEQTLLQRGHQRRGVRLDCGDLLALSREIRQILDEAGLSFRTSAKLATIVPRREKSTVIFPYLAMSWAQHRLCYTTRYQEVCMFVRDRMTPNPVIIGPHAMLSTAQEYMTVGHFRRLPVITEGTLIGMLTDRDIRRYTGAEERTKVQAAMTETPLTVPPDMTVEEATQLLLRDQFSGLPVVDGGKLVGIITSSDILNAFLDMIGATTPESVRINVLPTDGGSLADAAKILEAAGAEVLSIGTYRDPGQTGRGFFLRMRGLDAAAAAMVLRKNGYTVL